ncbi:MAG: dihydrolipoamide acetyltransferase family protein [Caldilineaceae bacterium]
MFEFKLPDVGEGLHEAEIARWLVAVGDTVTRDQPILEIETDKALVEIPSPVAGMVRELRAVEGEIVQVGAVLLVIAPATAAPSNVAPPPVARQSATPPPSPSASSPHAGIAGPGQRILAAPAVRKMALDHQIDLADVEGSGPFGRVLPSDIRRHLAERTAPAPLPPSVPELIEGPPSPLHDTPPTRQPLRGLRRRIAQRMEESWRTIPHVTVWDEADAQNLMALRQQLRPLVEAEGQRLSYLPLLIKITAQALSEFPYLNASLQKAGADDYTPVSVLRDEADIVLHRQVHMGIATAIEDGLLVPVLRNAASLSIQQIAVETERLTAAARERKLPPAALSGSTFTITNFGSFGGQLGTPIINPPEAAILGTGRITEKAVAIDGALHVRPMLPLVLSFDHRLIDGELGGRFMARVKALIEQPNLLLLELR